MLNFKIFKKCIFGQNIFKQFSEVRNIELLVPDVINFFPLRFLLRGGKEFIKAVVCRYDLEILIKNGSLAVSTTNLIKVSPLSQISSAVLG